MCYNMLISKLARNKKALEGILSMDESAGHDNSIDVRQLTLNAGRLIC